MKIDQIRATGRAACDQELPKPLQPATDLPRRAAPHRGSLRHASDSELAPKTLATPGHHYMLGDCFGRQHLGTQSGRRRGSSSLGQEVKVAPRCPSEGLSEAHRHHTPPESWLGPTSPRSPRGKAGGQHSPGTPASREWAGGPASRSRSCRQRPPGHGTDLVPALVSTDELSAAWRVFRNQNRMFPRCQPAAQGYQA